MDKTEVNMNVLNKVIAFKLLRILRDNGFIEDGKYANIERKSIQYGESIISQNKLVGRSMQMVENSMVMPTGVNTNRNRQRRVVFYGRVSSEHEAQLSALENQIQWYDDIATRHQNWMVLRKYVDEGIIYGEQKLKI